MSTATLSADTAAPPSASTRLRHAAAEALRENDGALEMADVAARANASVGLAYHHFGSKAGLLSAVIADFYDRYDAVTNQSFPKDLAWAERERLRTEAVVAFLFADPLAPIILTRMSGAPEAASLDADRLDQLVRRGAHNIATGQASGDIPVDLDPELAAAFVLGGVRQAATQALALTPRPARAIVAEACWSFIARTLGLADAP